jgi:hypothetical protein
MTIENKIVTIGIIAMMIISLIGAIYDRGATAVESAIIIWTIPPFLWLFANMADSA